MRKFLITAMFLIAGSVSAYADFVLNPTQVGQSGTVNYGGLVEGNPVAGLSASITFTLQNVDLANNIWTFGFGVDNTSVAPITNSRVSTFGFNTNPDFLNAGIVTGTVFDGVSSGNVPGFMNVEFCATAGPNCSGGAGGGVLPGDGIVGGSFFLDFAGSANAATQIAFSDLYVRYQSIVGTGFGDSGIGLNGGPTPFCPPGGCPIPGPMVGAGIPGAIAAFGLLMFHWRRRRRLSTL